MHACFGGCKLVSWIKLSFFFDISEVSKVL
jgi:hypothetical protein